VFAPESWVNAWDAVGSYLSNPFFNFQIPLTGKDCYITVANDPANAEQFKVGDIAANKKMMEGKCPNEAAKIGAFFEAANETINSLPEAFSSAGRTVSKNSCEHFVEEPNFYFLPYVCRVIRCALFFVGKRRPGASI
jgi:hypothetical protein